MSTPSNTLGPSLEQEFQDRLLAAVNEVKRNTRLGVTAILDDIQRVGAVKAAKMRLRTRKHASPFEFFNQPSKYFLATKRIGRMNLSVEAIALEPKWRGLFIEEEVDQATATLTEHGFNPSLETLATPMTRGLLSAESETSFALLRLGTSRPSFDLGKYIFFKQCSDCEATAKLASELRGGHRPRPYGLVRKHLDQCPNCRDLYPELTAAFKRFDEVAEVTWFVLLKIFKASMELGDEQLKRFHFLQPEDYQEPEHYELDLETQLDHSIRPICAWRAVRMGCQLGRFMEAFASTFVESGDLWLKWRKGENLTSISSSVRHIDRQLFALALAARSLLLIRSWPAEDDGVLWVPADEELDPVPGIVRLEPTNDMEEWEELLGNPPQDLNLLGILYLAQLAAIGELEEFEPASNQPGPTRESWHQLNRMEEMLRTIQNSQTETFQRQNAIIDELARMVLHMESTDQYACEQSLLAELSAIYPKLKPEVRGLLLASEQMYRTQSFAAPGKIIDGLATAFELQLQHSVMAGLLHHLKERSIKSLRPMTEWRDAEQRDRPLWSGEKPEKINLGTMRLILRHPQAEIEEFFTQYGLDRDVIQQATEVVYSRRNAAVHGNCFDIGTAQAIRADWFSWKGRPGGVYSALFRSA